MIGTYWPRSLAHLGHDLDGGWMCAGFVLQPSTKLLKPKCYLEPNCQTTACGEITIVQRRLKTNLPFPCLLCPLSTNFYSLFTEPNHSLSPNNFLQAHAHLLQSIKQWLGNQLALSQVTFPGKFCVVSSVPRGYCLHRLAATLQGPTRLLTFTSPSPWEPCSWRYWGTEPETFCKQIMCPATELWTLEAALYWGRLLGPAKLVLSALTGCHDL